MTPQGLQTYQTTSVKTADRRQLVTMLYEGVIKNLNMVIHAIEAGDNETRSARSKKALDIIFYLSVTLDKERGGEIAENLSNLYDYCRDIVNEGNIKSDIAKFKEAAELFNVILDGWKQIAEGEAPENISLETPRQQPVIFDSAPQSADAPSEPATAPDSMAARSASDGATAESKEEEPRRLDITEDSAEISRSPVTSPTPRRAAGPGPKRGFDAYGGNARKAMSAVG